MNQQKLLCRIVVCALCAVIARGAEKPLPESKTEESPEKEAQRMLRSGMSLLEDHQEERAIKLIKAIPLNFPKTTVRFQAMLLLGKYHSEKGEHELAIKNLSQVMEAEDSQPDERSEALYRIGICYYEQSDYGRALTTLRRVTAEYPWTIHANEAYYYIGLCHFQLKHWVKAIEALKMVGTSVPPSEKTQSLVESGQKFLVKVHDKDLRILKIDGGSFTVAISTESGDSETLQMSAFDKEGEYYLGTTRMELSNAVPNDGKLQVKGGDIIRVEYIDNDTPDGSLDVKRIVTSRVVSTAIVGFMDGAYCEYVHGVFADRKTFVRVKDFDTDVSDQLDKVNVRIYSQYKVPEEEKKMSESKEGKSGPEYALRDEIKIELKETDLHSGLFAGTILINEGKDPKTVDKKDDNLVAFENDIVCVEYVDKEHIGGLDDPRTITAKAQFMAGQIPDVCIAQREVDTEELRARKNLIEAKFYRRLAEIFRDVGLLDRAKAKADIGLEKIDGILRRSLKANIGQNLIEEAYRVKWELMIAKGDFREAVQTCRTLVTLYPSSTLADLALMQIAKANMEDKDTDTALQILNGIISLKTNPDLKAEARFLIATILEERAKDKVKTEAEKLNALAPAIAAYKACADEYPNSPFAGEALGKVIDFYLAAKDYARCNELIQTTFVDFPDAPFLDEMLLKWGMVLVRMQQYNEAGDKLRQLVRDYPNSPSVVNAQKVLEFIAKKSAGN